MTSAALRLRDDLKSATAVLPRELGRMGVSPRVQEFTSLGHIIVCKSFAGAHPVGSGIVKWEGSAAAGTVAGITESFYSISSSGTSSYASPGYVSALQMDNAGCAIYGRWAASMGSDQCSPGLISNCTYFVLVSPDEVMTPPSMNTIVSGSSSKAARFDPSATIRRASDSSDFLVTIETIQSAIDPQVIEAEYIENAKAAARQAIDFVRQKKIAGKPRVMMSDDGVLTLQWRGQALGAALIFAGDNTVSVALKNAQQIYSDSLLDDVPLDDALPAEFVSALEAIIG
jgi:hypothetical protein